MPTEDDLRVAFRDMERLTPDVADVLRAVYDHPRRSARSWRPPPRVLRAGLLLRAGLALGAAAVIAALAHGSATKATPIAAPTLRARLLAAIDTASGDILYTHGGPAPGGGTWQSPAYPRHGQEVHVRILGLGSDGTIFKDGNTPSDALRDRPAPLHQQLHRQPDQGRPQLPGRSGGRSRVWGECIQFILDLPSTRPVSAPRSPTASSRSSGGPN